MGRLGQTLKSTSLCQEHATNVFVRSDKEHDFGKGFEFKKNQMIQSWLDAILRKNFPLGYVIRSAWAARESSFEWKWLEVLWTLFKKKNSCQTALSCPRCSEEARPKRHHLLLWLQPLPVCLRLWLLLPLRRPLLLPRWHPASSAADPPPRRPHPSALLPRRQLPVHRRA